MIACLTVPYFSAAIERRDDDSLAQRPLVIGGQPWEPKPLYAFSQEAAQGGVRPGMSLQLAHLLTPGSHFMPANPPRYLDASGEVVDVLVDFSPLVEPEELWHPAPVQPGCLPVRYYLDLESLPLAEALPLVQEMGRTVRQETRLTPTIGLAQQRLAAQVAATLARPNHTKTVPVGEEAAFLADRPVDFLPLNKETAHRLRLLGIRTMGQLAALPATAVQTQFGAAAAALQKLVRGDPNAAGTLQPYLPEPTEQVTYHFPSPVVDSQALEVIVVRAAATLANRLQAAGLSTQTVHLAWEMERDRLEQSLTLRAPAATGETLTKALRELLREANLSGGVESLTVTMTSLKAAAAEQLALFASPSPHRRSPLFEAVLAKHGRCLYRPVLLDGRDPLPERRFRWQEIVPA
jgi:nucleotidyltransferase/DNA polymerase involved in DNA repair